MQDDSSVYVINKNSELLDKEAKIPKRENGESAEDSNSISSLQSQHTFQIAKKYKVIEIIFKSLIKISVLNCLIMKERKNYNFNIYSISFT